MTKKPIIIIIGLLILAVALGAVYYFVDKDKSNDETQSGKNYVPVSICSYNADASTAVEVVSPDYSYKFIHHTEESAVAWDFEDRENPAFKVNNYMVNYAVNTISNLESTATIGENITDLAFYGLDNPIKYTVYVGAETYSVEVGDLSQIGNGYYARKTGENTVYLISLTAGKNLRLTETEFKNPYMFNSHSGDVNYAKLICEGKVIFELEKDEAGWKMLAPIKKNSINITKISNMYEAAIRAQVQEYVVKGDAENPISQDTLKKYGLDNPKYEVEFKDKNGIESKCYFGNIYAVDNTKIYALYEGSVVFFTTESVAFIGDTTEEYIAIEVHTETMHTVSKIDFTWKGETNYMTLDCPAGEDLDTGTYTYNSKLVETAEQHKVYQELFGALVGIPIERLDLETEYNVTDYEPILSVTFTHKDDSSVKVEYVPIEDKADNLFFYTIIDGEYSGYIVRLKAFEVRKGIMETYPKLSEVFA
jgi:uncharacterized protein YpmB